MENVLKRYDKLLSIKKNLDGSVDVIRQSPFYTEKQHKIFTITSMYLGSVDWVLRRLIDMDTTRRDIVGGVLKHNKGIRDKKDSRNMHEDLADFMLNGGSTFIN